MPRLIGEHYEGDVRVSMVEAGDGFEVHYSQDITPVIDNIAAINADGGAPMNEGIGVPKYEVPVTVAMAYCEKRGIPWEKFCYTNEYDSEWPKLAQEYTKLVFDAKRKFHGVTQ